MSTTTREAQIITFTDPADINAKRRYLSHVIVDEMAPRGHGGIECLLEQVDEAAVNALLAYAARWHRRRAWFYRQVGDNLAAAAKVTASPAPSAIILGRAIVTLEETP